MKKLTLDALLNVIGELFSDEISIAITDTEQYIYYRRSKRIDLKLQKGDPIREGTLAHKAILSGKKISEFIDRDVLGIPYHGMAVPFHVNNELEGCVLAIYPSYTEGKTVVTIKSEDGWKPILFEDVYYMEAKERKTHVIAKNYHGTHTNALQDFEYTLPSEFFIRCHRSFIVNVRYIDEIYPDIHSTFILKMKNGDQIPVSQSYSSYFRKLLGF